MIKSCYIHIPFCEKICSYCDFCKEFYDKKKVREYLQKLKQEIKEIYQGESLDTIYIGGGTPTCLEIEGIKQLLEITDSLKKEKNIEFTIEGNIESITQEKLDVMRKHGINRISLGIESIHPKNLSFLERNHKKEEIVKTIKMIQESGISNINVDLIYAIPGETIEMLKEDIEFLLSLNVKHISTYSLIIEEHTKLGIHKIEPIQEEVDYKMYQTIIQLLKENQFIHYEISNFAKPGYESRHNKCYWLNEEYYGFGLGASSYQDNRRKTNTRSLTNYPNKVVEEELLTEEDTIEYEIVLNLRLLEGIDLRRFKKKYQKELKDLYSYGKLVQNHLLVEEDNHIRIPEELLYVSNEIIVKFLQTKQKI